MSNDEQGAPGPSGQGAKPNKPSRALFYIPNCRPLRTNKGKRISELAEAADVNRSTIEKIEHLKGVTDVYAHRVFNVLDQWHPALKLKADVEITTTPHKIQSPLAPSAQKRTRGA